MSSENALIKVENQQISPLGKSLLEDLRSAWGKREIEREVSAKDEETGELVFVKNKFIVDSPIKRMNAGVPATVFYRFVEMVKPEEAEHIQSLIQAGTFEVEKAIQAFERAPMVVMDKKIKPTTWEQAQALNTPSIATLVKYKGENKAEDLVHLMVMAFARKFGRRNDMPEEEIRELAQDIVIHYRHLTIADLKMILTNTLKVSKNRYNLDYQGMMALLEESFHEKMEHAAQQAHREHIEMTHQEKGTRTRKEPTLSGEGMSVKEQAEYIKRQAEYDAKLKAENRQPEE